jgi:hypothetical protein
MRTMAAMLATTLLFGGAALAVDDPDELMTGTSTTIKNGKLAKFSGKPTSATRDLLLPSSTNAPTSGGGSLQMFDTGKLGNEDTYNLPSSGWSRIPKNTDKLLKGFKYKGAGTSSDPCKSVTVKGTVVKATCKGVGVQLTTPFSGNVGIILTLGPDSKRYCAVFGGSGKNDPAPKGLKRKGASKPNACATPVRPTTTTVQPTTTSTVLVVTTSTSSTSSTSIPGVSTTSTSSTSSTSNTEVSTTSSTSNTEVSTTSSTSNTEVSTTSSTSNTEVSTTSSTSNTEVSTTSSTSNTEVTTSTSTPESSTTTTSIGGGGCCNGQTFVSFATVSAPGDCGDIIDVTGMVVSNINCGGLYTGGGGNSVPLPFAVPDLGLAISAITECTGQTAILGSTNSDETGSNRNCTNTGCLFGAPLAVPNAMTIPTSVCVTNTASQPLTGTAVCDTGATDVTGDKLGGVDGIQPCPLCTGGDPNTPNSGTCQGGPNNGMTCTPGTTAINASYPTSHDCPPDQSDSIGSLPVAFKLTSGTVSWNGTRPTNDTESTASKQTRVFSGFCRDVALPGGTGSFDASADPGNQFKQCWENGMAIGTPCADADNSAESCEQRNQGFFGPDGGAQKTILTIGSATSILSGPAFGALVSIFSIPPTFDATIDGAGDLPGPGAVAIPGTASLCSSANPCPEP